jgi:hypothetical protein
VPFVTDNNTADPVGVTVTAGEPVKFPLLEFFDTRYQPITTALASTVNPNMTSRKITNRLSDEGGAAGSWKGTAWGSLVVILIIISNILKR